MATESVILQRRMVNKRYVYADSGIITLIKVQSLYEELFPCTQCIIHLECRGPVGGAGNVDSRIVFVGRNTGRHEDKDGLPFVGKGGQLLNSFFDWVGLDREKVFITNLVKCYTTDDRAPSRKEIDVCGKLWLQKELALLDPKLIVTFGVEAAAYLTGFELKRARLRLHEFGQETVLAGKYTICCVHPGAPLRSMKYMSLFRDDARFLQIKIKELDLADHFSTSVSTSVSES